MGEKTKLRGYLGGRRRGEDEAQVETHKTLIDSLAVSFRAIYSHVSLCLSVAVSVCLIIEQRGNSEYPTGGCTFQSFLSPV
jgi:hypothetical protein